MIANAEQTAPVEEPKSKKKARVGARSAHVAKGNSGKKATSAKKAPKSRKRAVAPPARKGSKTAQVLDLIQRAGGATLQELMAATEWQPHSIRGFISGTLGKKLGLAVESSKSDKGERTYSLKG